MSKKKTLKGALAVSAAAGSVIGLKAMLNAVIGRNKPKTASGNKFMQNISDAMQPYKEEMKKGREYMLSLSPQRVAVISHDGLALCGHWIQAHSPQRTLVMMHGFRSSWDRDFSSAVRFFVEQAHCNLLIAEQRAHGESQGKFIGYGILERYDCIEWVRYADLRCGGSLPVYLDGMSMGATTVLLASELDLPVNVRGVIADSAFTSPAEIIAHVLKKAYKLPRRPILPLLSALCKITAGYGFYDRSTLDSLKNNTRPVLLVHGDADTFVPIEMALENKKASAAPCELFIGHGAGHGLSYMTDKKECEEALLRFFEKNDH